MNPTMDATLGLESDLVLQNNTSPSGSSSEHGSNSTCPEYGVAIEDTGHHISNPENARSDGVHMLSQGLCSADGDILRENSVVAHWPAAQNTLETAGAGGTRSPLAELSVVETQKLQTEQANLLTKQKQLLTKTEREAMKLERERAKLEGRLKREAEKQRKEQERKEKKEAMEKRERERVERKEQEREQKERKEAERKRKEEEKEAEKSLKVEMRRQQEMEREKANEEKLRKQQIAKERFLGFFKKVDTTPLKESSAQFTLFTPFMAKPNMVLAKPPRPPLEDTLTFDALHQSQSFPSDYLSTCKLKRRASPSIVTSAPADDVVIISPPPGGAEGSAVQKRKYKLIQFHDNYRPAYYGTWSSSSAAISSRNPFKMDKEVLNYDVDSDEEWEEEEPGEDISHSENEQDKMESGDDEEGDNDGFFVPHGYLSEGEGQSSGEEDGNAEEMNDGAVCSANPDPQQDKHRQRQLAKARAWEAKCANTCQPIKPLKVGCLWLDATLPSSEQIVLSREEQLLRQFTAIALTEVPISVEMAVAIHTKGEETTPNVHSGERRAVPEEAMPDLIALVHRSSMGLSRLNSTFRVHWATKLSHGAQANSNVGRPPDVARTPESNSVEEASGISKRQLTMKISNMAVKELRAPSTKPLWYVHDSVFKQYNLDPQKITPLVPLQPDVTPVMSPDTPQSCKRLPKRASIGTPTIRDLWNKPRSGGRTCSHALLQEEDPPLPKRPHMEECDVIMIDESPPTVGGGNPPSPPTVGGGGPPLPDITHTVAGGVASLQVCAMAMLERYGLLQQDLVQRAGTLSSGPQEPVVGLTEGCTAQGASLEAEGGPPELGVTRL